MSKTKIFGISTIILLIMIALTLTMWLSLYRPDSNAVETRFTEEVSGFTINIDYDSTYGSVSNLDTTTYSSTSVEINSFTFDLNSLYTWKESTLTLTVEQHVTEIIQNNTVTLIRNGNTWTFDEPLDCPWGTGIIRTSFLYDCDLKVASSNELFSEPFSALTTFIDFPVADLVEYNPNAVTYESEYVDIVYDSIYGAVTAVDAELSSSGPPYLTRYVHINSFNFELNNSYIWNSDSITCSYSSTFGIQEEYEFTRNGNTWSPSSGSLSVIVGEGPSGGVVVTPPSSMGKGNVYAATNDEYVTINFPVADLVEEIPYNILTFDPAGGSVSPTTMEVTNGESVGTLPTPTRVGYRFAGWYIGDTLISSGDTWNYSADQTAVAHWVQQFTVNAGSNNNSQGTVSGTTGALDINSSISLTATPTEHYNFAYWLVNGTQITQNPYTTTLTGNINAIAYFSPKTYTITPQSEDAVRGTVSGGGNITYGNTTTITATPTEHYTFSHWTLNGETVSGAGASYTFPPSGSGTYIAHFTPKQYTITIQSGDASLGIVSNALTNRTFDALTQITSTAYVSAIGYTLLYWQDDLGNKIYENPLNITLTRNSIYTAVFGKAVELNGICAVDINLISETIATEVVGYAALNGYSTDNLTSVHLWATPSKGYKFEYWTVDGQILTIDGTNPYTAVCDIPLELVQGKIVVANFSKIDKGNISTDLNN